MKIGFVGTYTEKTSEGIYQFHINEDTGELSNVSLFTEVKSSKYLATTEKYLFSLYEDQDCGVAVFDLQGKCLDKLSFEEGASCYLMVEENTIYTSNYHLGTVSKVVFEEKTQKLTHITSHLVREKAGCHQVIPCGKTLFVPCLHLDKVVLFDRDLNPTGEILFPEGSGPRHGVLCKEGNHLYILGELSNKVYKIDLKSLKIQEEISILPLGESQNHGGAALRLSEDGTRLYASTREEQNRITCLGISGQEMKEEDTFSCLGRHPRDILNVCNDRYLLVANRGTNTLHSFDIHNKYKEINNVEVPEGVSILLGGK